MRLTLFLAAIIGATLLSCKKTDLVAPTPTSLNGKWTMIQVTENTSGSVTTKPSMVQGDVEIIFTATGTAFGNFFGATPTNQISQSNYSTGPDQSLTIYNLSMTQIAETSWGNEFVSNIRNSQQYSFETNGRLNIKTTDKVLTFKKS